MDTVRVLCKSSKELLLQQAQKTYLMSFEAKGVPTCWYIHLPEPDKTAKKVDTAATVIKVEEPLAIINGSQKKLLAWKKIRLQ